MDALDTVRADSGAIIKGIAQNQLLSADEVQKLDAILQKPTVYSGDLKKAQALVSKAYIQAASKSDLATFTMQLDAYRTALRQAAADAPSKTAIGAAVGIASALTLAVALMVIM